MGLLVSGVARWWKGFKGVATVSHAVRGRGWEGERGMGWVPRFSETAAERAVDAVEGDGVDGM
jgi:hypothetical protein